MLILERKPSRLARRLMRLPIWLFRTRLGFLLNAQAPTHDDPDATAACPAPRRSATCTTPRATSTTSLPAGADEPTGWPTYAPNQRSPSTQAGRLDPPIPPGILTVRDVLAARDPEEQQHQSWAWARNQWSAWSRHHDAVRG